MTEKTIYTRDEAAKSLHVSLPVLDAWLRRSDNPIPCIRAGRRVLIPVEGMRKWVEDEAARNTGKAFAR